MMKLSLAALFLVALIQLGCSKYVQQQELIGTGATGPAEQGSSIFLSDDGKTLAVGGVADNNFVGAAWIFLQSNGVWSQKGGKIVPHGTVGASDAGYLAISGDGEVLAIGGDGDNGGVGATWIFTYGGWDEFKDKIVANDAIGKAGQGWSVALNYDGTVLVTSGIYDNNSYGATWVYQKINDKYVELKKFTPTNGVQGKQGSSVAISNDGTVVVSSAPYDGSGVVYVYRNIGSNTWTTSVLTASDATPYADFGASVSISGDGNTIAVGGPNDTNGIGASWIFTYSSGSWNQAGPKIVGTGSIGPAAQGTWVSLNGDGTVLSVGGDTDNNNIGATWIFTYSSGSWSQYGSKIVATGSIGQAQQGYYTALSADGNTLAISAWYNSNGIGAVFTFLNIVYPFPASYNTLVAWLFNGNGVDASGNINNAIVPNPQYYSFPQPNQPTNEALLPKGEAVISSKPIWFGKQLSIQVIFEATAFSDPSFDLIDLLPNNNSPLTDSVLSVSVTYHGKVIVSNPSTGTIIETKNSVINRNYVYSLVLSVDSDSNSVQVYLNTVSIIHNSFSFTSQNYYLSTASNFHGYVDQVIVYGNVTANIWDVNVGGPTGL